MATEGIYWFDESGFGIRLEYSDSLTSSPLVYTRVAEVKSITANPSPSDEIPFTHYASTIKERRLGLSNPGSWDVVCNFGPKNATHTAIIALGISKAERFWRLTYPKAVTASTTRAFEFFTARVSVASIAPPGAEDTNPVDFQFTLLGTGATYTFTPEA